MSKKTLAVILSKLDVFEKPNQSLEQYPTDSEIGATALWSADLKGWIKDKVVVDLGAGTGVLGIGCMLLGAKKAIFVEKDVSAIKILKKNLEHLNEEYELPEYEIIEGDICEFEEKADLVVMNPPFGTVTKGSDTLFLEKAASLSDKILTFHKTETNDYIDSLSREIGFRAVEKIDTSFPLKKTLPQHKKKIERIKVTAWLLEKI